MALHDRHNLPLIFCFQIHSFVYFKDISTFTLTLPTHYNGKFKHWQFSFSFPNSVKTKYFLNYKYSQNRSRKHLLKLNTITQKLTRHSCQKPLLTPPPSNFLGAIRHFRMEKRTKNEYERKRLNCKSRSVEGIRAQELASFSNYWFK